MNSFKPIPLNCLLVDCRTACECGCNRPARVEFLMKDRRIVCSKPAEIDKLIDKLIEGRVKLWGPRPECSDSEDGASDYERQETIEAS